MLDGQHGSYFLDLGNVERGPLAFKYFSAIGDLKTRWCRACKMQDEIALVVVSLRLHGRLREVSSRTVRHTSQFNSATLLI
jgi:hypothetical protein